MRTLKVDPKTGDIDPRFILVGGTEAVLIRATQRLRMHRGEWVLAVSQGPDYFGDAGVADAPAENAILGRGIEFVHSHIIEELRKAGIEATNVSFEYDAAERVWSITVGVEGRIITVAVTP